MTRRKFVLEDRPIHEVCSHGALVEVKAPYPRPKANAFDRWLLIGLLVMGCTIAPKPGGSPAPTGEIGEPSVEIFTPSGEVGDPLECGIPEGCYLPSTDMEAP